MRTCVCCLLFVSAAMAADVSMIEQIVAKVNGDIITNFDLDDAHKEMRSQLQASGLSGPALEQEYQTREKDVLRDKIDDLLLVQKGKELGLDVDLDVSRQLAQIQLQAKIPDQDKFHQFISQETGKPFEDYRAEMTDYYLRNKVISQEVASKITIPKAEIEKYYNDHKDEFVREERVFLREITISTEGMDQAGIDAAEKKAKDIVARARNGEKFEDLVRDNSDAPSKQDGGLLPAQKRDDLKAVIADAVFDKERNYITDPIRLDNAWEILRVEQQYKAGLASLEEVQNEIQDKLFEPRFQPKVREYLTQLRQDAFLELKEGYVDTSAAPGKRVAWDDPTELRPETVTKEEVLSENRRKRLLWLLPIPGTEVEARSISR